jgi:hypothetical protein
MPGRTNQRRTCKRKKVRIDSYGIRNKEDMEHNRKCDEKYMMIDNPWMKSVLRKKNPKGYDKFLKGLIIKKRSDARVRKVY